jgi:cell division protein ZapA (FtsZ GTPase activity inhibitor)
LEQFVTIELFGRPFTFKAESEVKQAEKVADYLVKEVTEVEKQQSQQSSNINKLAIIVLAALNIANKNMELKREHLNCLREISDRSAKLISTLDAFVLRKV